MVSITLAIPEEVKKKMDLFSEINWSGFIRKAIIKKTEELSWKEEMLQKLKEEQEITSWATELQRKGRKGHYEQLKKEGLV